MGWYQRRVHGESPALGSQLNMKLVLLVGTLLSFAAAVPEAEPTAEAEADPWYRHYGHGLRHYGYGHGYYGYRPYGHIIYGKREAEPTPEANPEAEADPWYSYYGHHGYHGYYRPYGYYGYRRIYG